MWAWAIWPWAADAPPVSSPSDAILTAVITASASIIVGLLGLIGVIAYRGRDRSASPPPPSNGNGTGKPIGERVAVLEDWRETTDEEFDMLDRLLHGQGRQVDGAAERLTRWGKRLDRIESYLDREDPGWRSD